MPYCPPWALRPHTVSPLKTASQGFIAPTLRTVRICFPRLRKLTLMFRLILGLSDAEDGAL